MVTIDIYLRGWLMSILLRTEFTLCEAKETMVNRTWAVSCIVCSRSRLMAMSYRVIPTAIKERKPNRILTANSFTNLTAFAGSINDLYQRSVFGYGM